MKKSLLLLLIGACLFPMNLKAEESALSDSLAMEIDTLGIHPYKKRPTTVTDFARWSLTFEVGMSIVDGDFIQPGITIVPKTKIRPGAAFSLTYDFTPVWGIIGTYSYGNYGMKQKGADDYLLMGHMHSLELLLSYDLTDAWFPRRKTNIFSLYLVGGLGLGFYNSDLNLPDGTTVNPRADGKYDEVGMISMGLLAEFNITREIGLGLKGLYHVYTNDMLDGKMQGVSNDCMEYASLYLRWKLEGRKKNHVRNLVDENNFLAPATAEQAEPQKDTVVMSQKDTLVIISKEIEKPVIDHRHYVYFDNDSYELTEQGLIKLQQFADLIQEDSTICIDLNGYCDNTGTEKHNETLSQNRAKRVSKELTTVYGISEDRIVTSGKGMLTNVESSYAPNRRVSIRLISKEECDSLRAEKEQTASDAVEAEATEQTQTETTEVAEETTQVEPETTAEDVVVEETIAAEDKPEEEVLAVVTSELGVTTLSRLARDYYNNTYCWPYIYEANTDVLPNPDFIPEGVQIRIPRLSDELTDVSNAESMAQVRAMIAKYRN